MTPFPSLEGHSSLPHEASGQDTSSVHIQWPSARTPCGFMSERLQANFDDDFSQRLPSSQHGLRNEPQQMSMEQQTLDSPIVQYLKHQHCQCPATIATLPHVCPKPRRSLDTPSNITSQLSTREFQSMYGGIQGSRKYHKIVYSGFRPWITCRDGDCLLTCISFLGNPSHIVVGKRPYELIVFETNSNTVLDRFSYPMEDLYSMQSHCFGDIQLVLCSSYNGVQLWDSSSISTGPKHSVPFRKGACFSNSGNTFAALSTSRDEWGIHLYDVQTCKYKLNFLERPSKSTIRRRHQNSLIHFSPSDTMLLWNGVMWDCREKGPVHRFDRLTDYGGGGFHPAGNEVVINSEVWDLRKFRLLQSVPSLNQTVITFNASGDIIYAILRRDLRDVHSALKTSRVEHPLFSAFRTMDAVNYSNISTIPVEGCILNFATEPSDLFVGLVTIDDGWDMLRSSARLYEIGRRKSTDDNS